MGSLSSALMVAVTMLLASSPAQSALITKPVTGSLSLPLGSPANIGLSAITGSVTYDDGIDFGVDPSTDLYALPQFGLSFSNGPTVTELDDPLAQIEVDTATNALVALTMFVPGLNGFGLSGLTFQTDFFAPTLFFSDSVGNVVVEGSVAFAVTAVPEPSSFGLFGVALLGLAAVRRRGARVEAGRTNSR